MFTTTIVANIVESMFLGLVTLYHDSPRVFMWESVDGESIVSVGFTLEGLIRIAGFSRVLPQGDFISGSGITLGEALLSLHITR